MATLEELQQQVAELQATVDALTTPPSDYYTHRWSGEEIDNAVGNVLNGNIVIPSSTSGSTKKFKITVDDSGNITATEVTTT